MRGFSRLFSASVLALTAGSAFAQTAQPVPSGTSNTQARPSIDPDEIVVTARRREESLQTVPVAIQAFSSQQLQQRGVQDLQDLSSTVAGLRFGSEGGKNGTNISLRGLSRIPLGEGVPAVVTYFADIPLAGEGSNLPTYDLASIQVLKGPQGTLFGQNTIGGAILVTPQAPTYEFEGYVEANYGNYDYRTLEGAVNVPIIADKVALRAAGQVRRRDGVVKNLSEGKDFDDIHQDSVRASLLVEPSDVIRSLTIFDYFKANEQVSGPRIFGTNPNTNGLSVFLDPQIAAQYAAQQDDFFSAYSTPSIPRSANRKLWGISNNTSVDLDGVTVRNIFGYRKVFSDQRIDSAGLNPVYLPNFLRPAFGLPAGADPFELILLDASQIIDRRYISNELQISGSNDPGTFDWIFGGFYYDAKSDGPMGSSFRAFVPAAAPRSFTTAHVASKSYAVFAQIGYEFAPGLKLNAGARYTWDRVRGCAGSVTAGRYATSAECETQAAADLIDGTGIIRTKSNKPSWTLGLDYQASDDVFLYAVTRRGIRGANINTPLFESPFTTGDPSACGVPAGTGPCPDLRPAQTTGPEQITDVEVGGKFAFRSGEAHGRLNVAVFYSKYKAALQFANVSGVGIPTSAPDQPTNTSVGVNVADETIYGIESEFVFSPVHGLTFTMTGAWTSSEIDKVVAPVVPGLNVAEEGITLPTPAFAGSVAVNYTAPLGFAELSVSADYFYTDKFGGSSGKNLPSYELANGRIDLRDIGGAGVDLGVFVRNIFEEKYFRSPAQFSPSFPVNVGYVGEPRTYGVSARFRF
ncbi:TonB-dependent receptor [Novosphingobium sp. BL-52-GroH]|uniref:TonB-dependent receptor n=1 Tax=Novosphingobium sp. BL-52-GroH TaxID=3349877 RepID=UPI0038514D21